MERISISWSPTRTVSPAALPIRARATGETYEIDPFRGSASSSPTILKAAPAVVSPERHPMPESDGGDVCPRRNELSCPQTICQISHVPRGDRDRATTFARILDLLRRVIGSATFAHRIGQSLQSGGGHQIRVRRDWPIRELDLRSRFGGFFPGEGHAHCSTFPLLRRAVPCPAASEMTTTPCIPTQPPLLSKPCRRSPAYILRPGRSP